jgi:hypothetical protein
MKKKYSVFFIVELEAEFQSLQIQNDERIEIQFKDGHSLQENIMEMAYNIEEMRQRFESF